MNVSKLVVCAGVVLGLGAMASAASVGVRTKHAVVTGTDLDANLTTADSGLIGTHDWSISEGGFMIAWNIDAISGGYRYAYTMTNPSGGDLLREISHFVLELSNPFTGTFADITSSTGYNAPEFGTHNPGPGNPGLPASIYGVKVDSAPSPTSWSFAFTSNRVPIWGDFYAKDGGGNDDGAIIVYNAGITTGNTGYFIARPDSASVGVVPLPAAAWMGMSLLGGVGGVGFYRRRQQSALA